jgi:hypothetical protein
VLSVKIASKPIDFGLLPCGYLPLDVDTFAIDNSGTAKEHVGRTMQIAIVGADRKLTQQFERRIWPDPRPR